MRRKPKYPSLSYPTRQREIRSVVKVSSEKRRLKKDAKKCLAIWDTGATSSVISEQLAKELRLQPIGATRIMTANGSTMGDIYLAKISLGSGISKIVEVTSADLGMADLLLGMDIIADGDFVISSDPETKEMCVSYRTPSQGIVKLS